MHLTDFMQHLIRAVRHGFAQPILENDPDVAIQAHDGVAHAQCAWCWQPP